MYRRFSQLLSILALSAILISCTPIATIAPTAASGLVPDTGPQSSATLEPTFTLAPTTTHTPEPTATATLVPSATPTVTSTETPFIELVSFPGYGDIPRSELLLPDLQTLPPFNLRYVINDNNGKRYIRFANAVWNSGSSDVELFGEMNPDGASIDVTQVISTTRGITMSLSIGEFIFHEIHNHWHWEGFSSYEVWSINPDYTINQQLATSGKVSYCVRDFEPAAQFFPGMTPLPGTPNHEVYTSCYWKHQGLSVGWSDTYEEPVAGQSVEITDLPDGTYALVSIADPGGRLLEQNEDNNIAIIYFSVEGRIMQRVEP